MSVAGFSVRRPVFVGMLILMVLLVGAISLQRLAIDLMPDITSPTLSISTSYTNAGPQEVEELVTRPIEEALAAVPGVEKVTSSSGEGSSNVRVSFAWGTDLDAAANEIRDRLDRVIRRLPEDAERPMLRKFDLNSLPVLVIGAASDLDAAQFRKIIDEQVKYRVERVAGVAALDIRGGVEREIHVLLDPDRINALELRFEQVLTALRAANVNKPAGVIEQGNQEALVRTPGEFRTLAEIRRTVITMRDGAPILLGDVAEVRDDWARVTRLVRMGQRPGIQLAVNKQAGTNTVEVARAVKEEIMKINSEIPQIELKVVSDSSTYIENSIANLGSSVLQGGVLAILILLVFLRSARSTLVIALSIPVSIVATFVLMYFNGFTLNMMSLGGLALGVGMLVDNSIVVLENIYRHMEERRSPAPAAAENATSEVASAIVSSTITTVVVFLPLIFVRGMSGEMFRQLAWVVSFSLLCSVIVALTVVPLMCSRILTRSTPGSEGSLSRLLGRGLERLERFYAGCLEVCLSSPYLVVLSSVVLLAVAVRFGTRIGVEAMPPTDESDVRVSVEMAAGTRLGFLDERFRPVERLVLASVPEATAALAQVGGGSRGGGAQTAEIRLTLVPRSQRTRSSDQIAAELRQRLEGVPGMKIRVRAGQGMFMRRLAGGGDEGVQIEVRGHQIVVADQLAARVGKALREVPGITDVRVSRESGNPEELVMVDRDKTASLDFSVEAVAVMLETALSGKRVGYLREAGDEYPLLVKLKGAERMSLEQILDLTMVNSKGVPVMLRNMLSPRSQLGPAQIERIDQERVVTVAGNVSGRSLGEVIPEVQEALRSVPVPEGFNLVMGGDHEEQQRSFRELMLMLLLANLFVYMVMACQYESIVDPLVVMTSVPLAAIGVIGLLLATGTSFNIQSFIGIIMLAGIVVNNAIILVDQIRLHRNEAGMEMRPAIVEAGRLRLRPILMTAATTILGLIPMSLGTGDGGEAQAPLARAVLGGLASSTLITLLVVPVLYMLAERLRRALDPRPLEMLVDPPDR